MDQQKAAEMAWPKSGFDRAPTIFDKLRDPWPSVQPLPCVLHVRLLVPLQVPAPLSQLRLNSFKHHLLRLRLWLHPFNILTIRHRATIVDRLRVGHRDKPRDSQIKRVIDVWLWLLNPLPLNVLWRWTVISGKRRLFRAWTGQNQAERISWAEQRDLMQGHKPRDRGINSSASHLR